MSNEKLQSHKSEVEEQTNEEAKLRTNASPKEEEKDPARTIEASLEEVPSSYKKIGNSEREGLGT